MMRAMHIAPIVLLATVVACAKSDGAQSQPEATAEASNVANTGASRGVGASSSASATPSASAANRVPLATPPGDACGWISADEARSILGALAESPRPAKGGCLYTLPMSAEMQARRAKIAALDKAMGSTLPSHDEPYAFVLQVRVNESTGERAQRLASEKMASWLSDSGRGTIPRPPRTDQARTASSEWDAVRMDGGRLGTISVTAIPENPEMALPRDKVRALTARVRDLVPDLPFPFPAEGELPDAPDPCALLTRAEAESVLGKLVVPPYRSANDGPLAHPMGKSCAYFTAKHHVLLVMPHWSGGEFELKLARGAGNILNIAVNDTEATSADTIEGTWDETAVGPDGRLLLRKGDRAVEIAYETSSTDKIGALKLGKIAIERIARAR